MYIYICIDNQQLLLNNDIVIKPEVSLEPEISYANIYLTVIINVVCKKKTT